MKGNSRIKRKGDKIFESVNFTYKNGGQILVDLRRISGEGFGHPKRGESLQLLTRSEDKRNRVGRFGRRGEEGQNRTENCEGK